MTDQQHAIQTVPTEGDTIPHMADSLNQIGALRDRIERNGLSEGEFTAAIAGIVAATPDQMEATEGLMISQAIRVLKAKRQAKARRPTN